MSHPYDFTRSERFGLLGAAAVAGGLLLPWTTTAYGSRSGLAGDGWLLLLLASVVAGSLLFREWDGPESLGAAAVGLLVLGQVVSGYTTASVLASGPAAEFVNASPGVGLYVAAFGGVALVASGATWLRAQDESVSVAGVELSRRGQSRTSESTAD